ncbi:MAG: 3-deoxy-8-phosphooctulonate synthase [Ferrovibrio sp.]|uniref:3-deoxy-8-phosphooctulonate synthase n=1 Tax=Ferrovibrio sp. TaxID=1917215 RepID=UPI00263917D0|nr:3-deoxy-8-phosphooctulonate synthase [Ferrovibrio sp.]MCW0236111.1 3-deoxy-8-phosphooctulonate synthase [Ferrovibrio sp.]
MAALTLEKWNLTIGDGKGLFCILGLNVIEDMDLALATATELKALTTELGLPFVFKASFDKANRSSINSYRGPGLDEGLKILSAVKQALNVPIATDLHEPFQAEPVAAVADLVQIPAFLVRQTDLIVAAARATQKHKGLLHVKKAQFLAPWDCRSILHKIEQAAGPGMTILCERGASFGYNNLIVDMLAIPEMQRLGVPVTIDATHAVQLPGAREVAGGGVAAGGRREGVAVIAAAAVAAGADGVFLEFHPDPDKAKCDGPSCLPLSSARAVLTRLKALYAAARH